MVNPISLVEICKHVPKENKPVFLSQIASCHEDSINGPKQYSQKLSDLKVSCVFDHATAKVKPCECFIYLCIYFILSLLNAIERL